MQKRTRLVRKIVVDVKTFEFPYPKYSKIIQGHLGRTERANNLGRLRTTILEGTNKLGHRGTNNFRQGFSYFGGYLDQINDHKL